MQKNRSYPMGILWLSYGYPMGILWVSYGAITFTIG